MKDEVIFIVFFIILYFPSYYINALDLSACIGSSIDETNLLISTRKSIIRKVKLKYPNTPYFNSIDTGCVKLIFNINENGIAENIKIMDSYPKHYFDKSAITALKAFKFKSNKFPDKLSKIILSYEKEKESHPTKEHH